MTVLALDIASNTGAAWDAPGGRRPLCASWRAPYADPKDFGSRFLSFMRWLDEVVLVVKPRILAFEAPLVPHGANMKTSADTVRYLIGLASIAEMVASDHEIEVVEENLGTIKKYFTGSGHAKKHDMMARAKALNWAAANHNEADAAGLWAYVKAMDDPAWSFIVTPIGQRLEETRNPFE